ncbi:MAG: hypothetical protein Ct9H300mP28_28630 [Pseudomonadota bacterium]|nr:MAG: hypothetical protein Ct9H300mP28_28630 [Pseudomonadota bacterium]
MGLLIEGENGMTAGMTLRIVMVNSYGKIPVPRWITPDGSRDQGVAGFLQTRGTIVVSLACPGLTDLIFRKLKSLEDI